jgi:hypothetical protein
VDIFQLDTIGTRRDELIQSQGPDPAMPDPVDLHVPIHFYPGRRSPAARSTFSCPGNPHFPIH